MVPSISLRDNAIDLPFSRLWQSALCFFMLVFIFCSWISKIYLSAIYSTQRKSDSTPPIVGRAKLFVDACRTPVALDSSWFPTCSCLTASSAPSITFVESATHGHLRLTIQCLCGRLPRSAQFVLLLSFHVLRSKRLLCAIYTIIQHIAIFTAHLGDCLVFFKDFYSSSLFTCKI